MLHLKFWGSANFCFREIIATTDPILMRLEMGVAPLECKESVPTLQNKNLKEHCTWCIAYKICVVSISCLTKATKKPIFRLSSYLEVCGFGIFKKPSSKLYLLLIKFVLSLYKTKGYKTKTMPLDKNVINAIIGNFSFG